jgi:hypothetical protein
LGNKPPPHKERYDDDDDESTAQCFQLLMTISDSNAVTTINNATYQKSVMIGRDYELETHCGEVTCGRSSFP